MLVKILLLGFGYIFAAVTCLAVLAVLLVYIVLRSRGLKKSEARLGGGALIVSVAAFIASFACFAGADGIQRRHERELIGAARALVGACNQLGDTQPLPAPGKVLVWDLAKDSRSKVDEILRPEIRAGWNDEMLIFLVEKTGGITVWVVRWPQKEAVGKYAIRGLNEAQQREFAAHWKLSPEQNLRLEYGDRALIYWIDNLPSRPRGDGPDQTPTKP